MALLFGVSTTAYAVEPSVVNKSESFKDISDYPSQKLKADKKKIHEETEMKKLEEGYSSQLNKWKEEEKTIKEIQVDGIKLHGDEKNLKLSLSKEIKKKNMLKEKQTLESVKKSNESELDYYIKNLKDIGDDSKLDAYIAYLSEKEGRLEDAYSYIREALSKQPDNELYKKMFIKIYEKRSQKIINQREEILEESH